MKKYVEPPSPEYVVIPCPHCGLTGNHKGTCELSFMRTGKHWIVVAVTTPPNVIACSG